MKYPFANHKDKSIIVVATICLSLLVILPLLVESRISARHSYYVELLRAHECFNELCAADFDGDGTLGRVFIDRSTSPMAHQYWLMVKEKDNELIRLPYWELDTSARTHVATKISFATGKTQLLLYEKKGRDAPTTNAVYEWNGNKMTQVAPSEHDQDLFRAMASTDDNGTNKYWVVYRLTRVPILFGYYLLLTILTGIMIARACQKLDLRSDM
jgi:hypothetical protein